MRRLTDTALLPTLLVSFLLVVSACALFRPDPREQFLREMNDKFDELVLLLSQFGPQVNESPADSADEALESVKQGDGLPPPDAWKIIEIAEGIQEQFDYISDEFLRRGPSGLDAWGERLKADFELQRGRVCEQEERIKHDLLKSPVGYVDLLFGVTVDISRKGELFFKRGGKGYVIDKMLEFDLDAWLAGVKEATEDQ